MPRSVHPNGNLSISQVVSLLRGEFADLTESKIRFLEQQALIEPKRNATGHRTFGVHDVAVLKWILTCQRDQFLPLSVIGERIERGEHLAEIWTNQDADDAGVARAVEQASRPELSELAQLPGVFDAAADVDALLTDLRQGPFTIAELAATTGSDVAEVERLATFGLLGRSANGTEPRDGRDESSDAGGPDHGGPDDGGPDAGGPDAGGPNDGGPDAGDQPARYGTEALVVTRIAREFAAHGLDARHLRMIRNAAARDVAMFAQSLQPVALSGRGSAAVDTQAMLERMAVLSQRLRAVYLCEEMAATLGSPTPDDSPH